MSRKTTEFGKLCRSYRAKLGMNMTQLGGKLGKKQSIISRVEQGNYPLSLEYITKSFDVYGVSKKAEQMEFLLSCFNSIDKFTIPVKELGPLGKEWLAAIFTFGNISKNNLDGWDELISWIKDLTCKLEEQMPEFNTLGKSEPI